MILQYTQLSFPGSSRDKFRNPGFSRIFRGRTNPDMHVESIAPLKVRNLCMQALFKDYGLAWILFTCLHSMYSVMLYATIIDIIQKTFNTHFVFIVLHGF